MANKSLRVVIKDSENTLFDGEADRVSSFNEVGRFDVLPMHANFISMINQELSLFQHRQKIKEMKIEQAIIKVKQDVVKIFIGLEALDTSEEPPAAPKNK